MKSSTFALLIVACIFALAVTYMTILFEHDITPRSWWSIELTNPTDITAYDFAITNNTDDTEFQYQIHTEPATFELTGDVIVGTNQTIAIQPSMPNSLPEHIISVIISVTQSNTNNGDATQEIYRYR